jgi:tetratricopeptide (TPR) repeat protein
MKTNLAYFVLFFIFSFPIFSQEIPIIAVGEKKISVKKLKVDVTVLGDIAITTFDMQFYNPNNRVLEGELSFPLEENQSVIRFALEINGNLRDAVVVEKEKARVAFETTVRNNIDPALLEKTKGNNYKARIYPIPAKGYKRVVLSFQQKLLIHNDAYFYKIPFNYKSKLEIFSFKMKVLNQKNKPIITKGFNHNFKYNTSTDSYFVEIESRKTKVAVPLTIKIPLNANKERVVVNNDVFYFSKQLNLKIEKNNLENEITVFWDASLSQKNKKNNTEFDFLNEYFTRVANCKVKLVVFNTEIREEITFNVQDKDWSDLKIKLRSVVYDGASSFDFLSEYEDTSKLNILFTDGLNTLSSLNVKLDKKTHIVNSAVSANHNALKVMAEAIGGHYINLKQLSIKSAFDRITTNQMQFLGANISEDFLEIYPKKGVVIRNNFSITGKGKLENKNIKLFFGTKQDTLKKISFVIKGRTQHPFVSKIWAQKKLEFLAQKPDKNEKEIIKISKEYQIISDFTSMIILDRVEDYATYSIEPPIELMEKYDLLISRKINDKKESLASLKNVIVENYKYFFNWYDQVFEKRNPSKNIVLDTAIAATRMRNLDFTLTGMVSDGQEGFPGVSVQVKNERRGVQTDFDGKYVIDTKTGDILVFSYLGYNSKEITVANQQNVNIRLEENNETLDEIVVVGYGVRREKEALGYSVTNIQSANNVSNTLQGSVAGVQIGNNSGAVSNSAMRGIASVQGNSKPLYIVDGVIVSDIFQINSEEIKSSYVLNSAQGVMLYGDRASNGIVVISTKEGENKNAQQISDFENLVTDKVELKGWNPKTPYLEILNSIEDPKKGYSTYLELREKYHNSPSFYIDVADFFKKRHDNKTAIQILTNVAEIDIDNYELLKGLAYKFEEYNLNKFAIYTYREILKLRPEDIQSYRDLALAYEKEGSYQTSLDMLYKIVNGELLLKDEDRRFSGIEVIALNEMNRLISLYSEKLEINHIDKRFIKETTTDIRVVIDWNHNDTDIDLWVTDPNNEKCYYSHKKTKIGGLMSEDMTEGFGPEQFMLKDAIKGSYKINVKYFANTQQKISGPTFLKISTYKNYGTKNEIKNIKLIRLTEVDDILDVGELKF